MSAKEKRLSRRKFLEATAAVAVGSSCLPAIKGISRDVINGPRVATSRERVVGSTGWHYRDSFAPTEAIVKPIEKPYRRDICLSGAWQFQPVEVPAGFSSGEASVPELPGADAHRWEKQPNYVPSPWNVNNFADQNGEGGDFRCYPSYPAAWNQVEMGWLRKSFTVPTDWSDSHITLHFGAIAGHAVVFVNGKKLGEHFDIFLPFEVDATTAIVPGSINEVLVGVRKASLFDEPGEHGRRTYQGGSFWGQHIAGIWQDVFAIATPRVHVSNVYILPKLDADILEAEVTLTNDTDRNVTIALSAEVFRWVPAGKNASDAALPSPHFGSRPVLGFKEVAIAIPARGVATATLRQNVSKRLRPWNPSAPTLYGLVVEVRRDGTISDKKLTRFGWRQIMFRGPEVLLNGEPLILRGDSWHFMGSPQMTRRYACAWFDALKQAGLNAVRLHAQPYPEFYLDVADEMGILVLDETAVWASDGGPKLDDPAFWEDSSRHLGDLVRRDRNHPCVFGWSVCNEVMPVIRFVMRNPPGLMDRLVRQYEIWAEICRRLDPTRLWISADGDEDGAGKLPVFIVHYGGVADMQRAVASGKPWGVGETGNAYYATPAQVAETNGNRAYDSMEGRIEGVAISSYKCLIDEREHGATYRSVFNLVWYGLCPLPFGMADTSRPPWLEDGIFFPAPVEGVPGMQPERLGPYTSTLNPGYDPSLPSLQSWPLFVAIKEAVAEPPVAGKWSKAPVRMPAQPAIPAQGRCSARVLAGAGSTLAKHIADLGVPLEDSHSQSAAQILFVDGCKPPDAHA